MIAFSTSQKFYMRLVKRPIGFLGALVALILLSPLFIATMVLLVFANRNGFKGIFFTQDRPGMTGWSQIHGRNTLGWDDRFEMDVYYVEHISLVLDMKIFFQTIWKVLKREGDIPDKKEDYFDVERKNKDI